MALYCYTAQTISAELVKNHEPINGHVHGFIYARSQTEALRLAMQTIIDYVKMCYDYDPDEMYIHKNDTLGSITIYERETNRVINHIGDFAVHEC